MTIWKRVFPSHSSGATRRRMNRWMRFQQSMNKKRWFELDRERNGPLTLFDFSRADDALDAALVSESNHHGGWRISDDSVIGGFSRASLELVQKPLDYHRMQFLGESPTQHFLRQFSEETEPQPELDHEDDHENEFIPFVRWKGTIDTRVGGENNDVQRSGFCSIRSPEFPFGGADLDGRYNGIEIMCRSDGRPFSLNLKVDSFIDEDLYQTFINIPPTISSDDTPTVETGGGRFDLVVLLFQHFIVTAGGRMRANQRDLDNSVKIRSIGVTLMDGMDGDFQFDLARIRAVNFDETGVVGQAD